MEQAVAHTEQAYQQSTEQFHRALVELEQAGSRTKVADRDTLKPRRDPYFTKLSKGNYLGFRKMTARSTGTWLARSNDEAAATQVHKTLGEFSELPAALRYDAAKKEAEAWFDHLGKGGAVKGSTVRRACEQYVDHLKQGGREKTAADVEGMFKRNPRSQPFSSTNSSQPI